jgi:xanthine dehydrogenase iron-sulfur cluster and FAD-binding subunit A
MTSANLLSNGKADSLILFVNTKKYIIKYPDPRQTLIGFLRANGLKGTKLGCAEGYFVKLTI